VLVLAECPRRFVGPIVFLQQLRARPVDQIPKMLVSAFAFVGSFRPHPFPVQRGVEIRIFGQVIPKIEQKQLALELAEIIGEGYSADDGH